MGFLRGFRGFWVWESRFWPLLGAEKPLNGRVLTSFGAKKPLFGAEKPLLGDEKSLSFKFQVSGF
jgi:hypothetical protein